MNVLDKISIACVMLIGASNSVAATSITIHPFPDPIIPTIPAYYPPILPEHPGANPGLEITPGMVDASTSGFYIINGTSRRWTDFHIRFLFPKPGYTIGGGTFFTGKQSCGFIECAVHVKKGDPGIPPDGGFYVTLPTVGATDKVFVWATVPEPQNWALMIMGFSLVGGAMRKTRASVIATG